MNSPVQSHRPIDRPDAKGFAARSAALMGLAEQHHIFIQTEGKETSSLSSSATEKSGSTEGPSHPGPHNV